MGYIFASVTKECCECHLVKALEDFHNEKKNKDGKQNKCMVCVRAYSSNYRRVKRDELHAKRNYSCKKYKAQCAVRNEVKTGRLIKPESCESCNTYFIPLLGHHDDYDHPLDVRWLCCKCHGAWHLENGEALNPC